MADDSVRRPFKGRPTGKPLHDERAPPPYSVRRKRCDQCGEPVSIGHACPPPRGGMIG